jgi:hypothetical protein
MKDGLYGSLLKKSIYRKLLELSRYARLRICQTLSDTVLILFREAEDGI